MKDGWIFEALGFVLLPIGVIVMMIGIKDYHKTKKIIKDEKEKMK